MTILSLVIPCYNEVENIPSLLERCEKAFFGSDVEVILVDNGSIDNTPNLLRELLPRYSFARSVRVEKNQGYGYGILTGLAAAAGKYVGWTHADLQTDPKDALIALDFIKTSQEPLYLKGKRHGRSLLDLIFTIGMSFFDSCLLGKFLWDINGQPNIMPKEFYQSWKNPPHDFSLDLYAYYMAKKQGLKIKRFPVYFGKRVAGEAHNKNLQAKLRYSLRTIKYSWALKKQCEE